MVTKADPPGLPAELDNALRLVLAPNPSPMTFTGTNTYILGRGTVCVIDPGPAIAEHKEAILAALSPGENVGAILVTHAHLDHSPLARPLADATGAPVLAYGAAEAGRRPVMDQLAATGLAGGGEGVDHAFAPDRRLADGETLRVGDHRVTALHTPGHMSNHLCFATDVGLFSGDHVMGWSTSLVSPPDGDLTAFMASCERLATRTDARYFPGHGPWIEDPAARLTELIAHRRKREGEIVAVLAKSPETIAGLTAGIYADTPPALHPAAARNVLAHLVDLAERGLVRAAPELSETATFHLI